MIHEDIFVGFFVDALPINKMSDWLSRSGFTQICVIRGTVSLPGAGNGAGELQLWYHEKKNQYLIYALKTTGDDELVCKSLMFYSFTSSFKSAVTKSNRY